MIDAEFRPITTWPGTLRTDDARQYSQFSAGWSATLDLLDRELGHLDAQRIVIEVALQSGQIRADGWPKANARMPEHPGVILSFESKHGPLRYATDLFKGSGSSWGNQSKLPGWQANIRAIALGLEALRKVDRYGITERGEQYTGWSALPPGTITAGPAAMTYEQARAYLAEAASVRDDVERLERDPSFRSAMFHRAAKTTHPDTGGDPEQFKRLTEAKRVLDGGR